MDIENIIDSAKNKVKTIVENSQTSPELVISRYTAAVAVNFTDWIGKTIPWIRHENAYYALVDNMRCESVEDHVEMLLNFAKLSDSMPNKSDYEFVEKEVQEIRKLFRDPASAGLSGVALCAVLENTSEIFIPDLAKKAKERGCENFTYTDVHGEADVEHSQAFTEATGKELTMGYHNHEIVIEKAMETGINLIRKIYS